MPPSSPSPGDAVAPSSAPADSAHLELGAAAGGRIAGPGGFVSPDVGVVASLTIARWELGVLAQWEPLQAPTQGAAPSGFAMSSFATGVLVGRRQPVGGVDIVAGALAAVTVTSETGAGAGGGGATGGPSSAEPRAGLYAGLAFPRRARLRLRPMLGADLAASRVGTPLVIDSALPPLPWWSMTASLGVEWEPL